MKNVTKKGKLYFKTIQHILNFILYVCRIVKVIGYLVSFHLIRGKNGKVTILFQFSHVLLFQWSFSNYFFCLVSNALGYNHLLWAGFPSHLTQLKSKATAGNPKGVENYSGRTTLQRWILVFFLNSPNHRYLDLTNKI